MRWHRPRQPARHAVILHLSAIEAAKDQPLGVAHREGRLIGEGRGVLANTRDVMPAKRVVIVDAKLDDRMACGARGLPQMRAQRVGGQARLGHEDADSGNIGAKLGQMLHPRRRQLGRGQQPEAEIRIGLRTDRGQAHRLECLEAAAQTRLRVKHRLTQRQNLVGCAVGASGVDPVTFSQEGKPADPDNGFAHMFALTRSSCSASSRRAERSPPPGQYDRPPAHAPSCARSRPRPAITGNRAFTGAFGLLYVPQPAVRDDSDGGTRFGQSRRKSGIEG